MAGTLGRLALELGISNKELIGGLAEGDAAVGSFESKTTGSMSKVGKSIAALAVVGVIVGLGIASIHSAEQFQSSTASIATNAGITQVAADNIGKAFLGAGNDTLSSGKEMADAFGPVAGQLGQLAGHALSAKDALGFMDNSARLAEASGGALDSTTQALTTVMKAYNMTLGQSGTASDILFNASRLGKSSVEELANQIAKLHTKLGEAAPSLLDTATAAAALDQAGAQGRGLMMFSAGITNLLTPSKTTTAEMKTLGLNVYDAQGKFVGMGSIIAQLQPKLAGMSDFQRRAAESTLFGKTAAELFNNVIAKGPAAYAQLTTAVGQHGTAAAAAALKAKTLEGAHKALNKAVSDAMVTIGTQMIPAVNSLARTALPPLIAASGFLADHLTTIVPIVLGVVGALVALKVISLAQAVATGLVTVATTAWTVASGIAKVAQIAWAVVTGIATGQVTLLAAAQWLLNVALNANPIGLIVLAIAGLVVGIIYAYTHVGWFRDFVNLLWKEIQILWGWISQNLMPILGAVAGVIGGAVVGAVKALVAVFQAVASVVTTVWNGFTGFVGFLSGGFTSALNAIKGPIQAVGNVLSLLDPTKRRSPSLVDNVTAGVGIIAAQYKSLSGMKLSGPSIGGMSAGAFGGQGQNGPQAGAGGGIHIEHLEVNNPSRELDLVRALQSAQYLATLKARGLRPAPQPAMQGA